jgi:peptidoglycan-N-acetylglucosamine deacetylase
VADTGVDAGDHAVTMPRPEGPGAAVTGGSPVPVVERGRSTWPGGARAAVCFTFDFDAEEAWIGLDGANAARPGVLSQGTYGAKVAVPLILEILSRHGVQATFFVPGRVGERHPGRVREILAGGHEVAHHGYRHLAPNGLSELDELEELRRGRAVLEALGAVVTGYRAPDWNVGGRTIELLGREGFAYSSNYMDDIRPYRHPGSSVVELPVHWILDDAAHFWFSDADFSRKLATNAEVSAIWDAEEDGIVSLGGACVYTFHPQVIGRPGRLRLLEDRVARAAADPALWVTTAAEAAASLP